MNFSDKIKGDLPFEDIPDVENDIPEEVLEELDTLLDEAIKDILKSSLNETKDYAKNLSIFFAMDKFIREERGIEDKEERYRIIDMIIRM